MHYLKRVLKSVPGVPLAVRIIRGRIVFSRTTWRILSIVAAITGGVCSGTVFGTLSDGHLAAILPAAILGGLITGVLVGLLGFLHIKLNEAVDGRISLQEMTNIRPLIDGPPLDFGKFAIDPHLGKVLAQIIYRHNPDYVVECGSGTSTVFVAKLLKKLNPRGYITALEHLDEYAEETKRLIQDHSCTSHAEVRAVPLTGCEPGGKDQVWYGVSPNDFRDQDIDLLLVDGPPSTVCSMARYPAVPLLRSRLGDNCIIVMDDGDRPEDEEIARRWAENEGADLKYVGGPRGIYVLRL